MCLPPPAGTEGGFGGTFDLSKGGNDTVTGNVYTDTFKMGAALTAADRLTGNILGLSDTIELDGNYTGSRAVTFAAATAVGFTTLVVDAGHSYNLTSNNATVGSGETCWSTPPPSPPRTV